MKTVSLLLGSALLLAPALALAEDAPPAPSFVTTAPVYSRPSWVAAAPAAGSTPERLAPTRLRSTGLLVGGIVIASLGTASLIGGAVMLDEAAHAGESCSGSGHCLPLLDSQLQRTGGTFFTINGAFMVLGGAAMALAGGWQVPVSTRRSGSAAAMPAVAVGPGNATLRWSF